MRLFLGTDICEIQRIEDIYKKYGQAFLKKIYTLREINYCLSNEKMAIPRLAARFAAKEAVSKALKIGMNGLGWEKGMYFKDIEILKDENGAVSIKLYGKAHELEKKLCITDWEVSISHSKTNAIATVIGYMSTQIS